LSPSPSGDTCRPGCSKPATLNFRTVAEGTPADAPHHLSAAGPDEYWNFVLPLNVSGTRWDPNWESVYRYKNPVFLPKCSVVSMRYHYHNSTANPRHPNQPPRPVRGGNQATDEMAHLWLQVLPRGDGDHRMELQEAIIRHRLEKYPGEFTSQFNLGALMLAPGDNGDGLRYLRRAASAQPRNPVALLQSALDANPRYTNARYNLASALAEQHQLDRSAAEFRKVLAESPDDAGARQHLGEVLRLAGDEQIKAGHLEDAAARLAQ
jgi:tetratricopeptide (TPR) repeat protein